MGMVKKGIPAKEDKYKMASKTKELYSLFVKNHSLFGSVDEILQYKQLWPLKGFVEEKVKSVLPFIPKKKYHMGLDISSRSTGLCILDANLNIIAYKAIHPSDHCKGNSILSAASIYETIQAEMLKVGNQIDPSEWNIVIEKYLQMFGASTFRTQSLFYLAEINGIIQYKCWEEMNAFPRTFHPSTARSLLNIKSAGSREETKKVVFDYVRKQSRGQIDWPQKKRNGGYSDDCFDIADAYVLAKAGWIESTVDAVLHSLKVSEREGSSFFTDFVKINIVHFIKKYINDDSIQSITTLPPTLVDKYYLKLRELVTDCIKENISFSVC